MSLLRYGSILPVIFFPATMLAEITPKPPNIILILADDLGYGDLGITGSKQIPTPHIDSLAADGIRFTNAYVSSPVCAPSRAGLMTGKHPASFGFRDIGKILTELRAREIERDTLVVFLSDNGGPSAPGISNGSCNAPFRGSKTTVLEGGIRVPMILKWPAALPPGKTVDAMVSSLDLFPTFVNAAGGSIKPAESLTGVDLLPALTGKSDQAPHESLIWTYTVGSAIRTGDWKLVRLPDRLPMLYDLSAESAEQKDLSLEHPDRTRSMLKELGNWEVRTPNPVFREPADWRIRHLRFYDCDYPMLQPD